MDKNKKYKGKLISKLTKAELLEAYWDLDKNYKSEVEDRKGYVGQINNLEKKNKNQKENIKNLELVVADYKNELAKYLKENDSLKELIRELETSYSEFKELEPLLSCFLTDGVETYNSFKLFRMKQLGKLTRQFLIDMAGTEYGKDYIK